MSATLLVVGRGFCFEDLKAGFRFRTHRRTIAESDLAAFVNLTWLTEELFAVADASEPDAASSGSACGVAACWLPGSPGL